MQVENSLSRAEELLTLCARVDMPPDGHARLAVLLDEGRISWEEVLYKAKWYRIEPLLYHHLRHCGDGVPRHALDSLKAVYLGNAARNSALRSELTRVLTALEAEDIPVVLLKGSSFVDAVYGNPALRPMSDVDVLVPEDMVERAYDLVVDLGYHPVASPEMQENTRKNHRHMPTLAQDAGLAVVEVHSNIVSRDSPLRFEMDGFWSRAREGPFPDLKAMVLSPQDMLLHVCIHFLLDRRFRSYGALAQTCDIHELVRRYGDEIDWQALTSDVSGQRLSGPLYCALFSAQTLLGTPVPEDFMEKIRPASFDASAARLFLRRRVLDARPVAVSAMVSPRASYSIFNLARSALRRLVPSKRYMAAHYYGTIQKDGLRQSYLERLGETWTVLAQYARHPIAAWQQVRLDRWIHSLQSGEFN